MKQTKDPAERIREWLMTNFPTAKKRQIGLHDSLLESGIIDSLGTLEVVQFLEDEFQLEVNDDEMVADHFDTIQSISEFVKSKQSQNSGETGSL